jgi:DNA-binding response OmpR family regulator
VRLINLNLELEGFSVISANNGKLALQMIKDQEPTLVLLDIMLPNMDGFQVCARIREFSDVPIIMITAKGGAEDIVHGLDIGADDYVIKPFSINELVARVKAVLHRAKFPQENAQPPFACGHLSIDFNHHLVTIEGKEVLLPPTEYRILCLLARNAGRVLTHDQLLTEVWGREYRSDTHILQVAVARLRKRLGDDPGIPKYIVTRPGIGYTFRRPKEPCPPSVDDSLFCATGQDTNG